MEQLIQQQKMEIAQRTISYSVRLKQSRKNFENALRQLESKDLEVMRLKRLSLDNSEQVKKL